MRTKLAVVAVAIGLLLAVAPVWAHHVYIVEFDVRKPVTLRGTLTKMEWKNPHGWIYLDVKGADGQVEDWVVETGSPAAMRGLKITDFPAGG